MPSKVCGSLITYSESEDAGLLALAISIMSLAKLHMYFSYGGLVVSTNCMSEDHRLVLVAARVCHS